MDDHPKVTLNQDERDKAKLISEEAANKLRE